MPSKLTRKQVLALSRALKRQGRRLPAVNRCAVLTAWEQKVGEVCHEIEGGNFGLTREDKVYARVRKRTRQPTITELHTGRPSWHQQRAGHVSAGVTIFPSREEAERAWERFKQRHPDEPAFVVTRRLRRK